MIGQKLDQGLDLFGNNKTVVMFFAPSKDVNLAIIIDKLAPNTTINQYTKENININNNTMPLGWSGITIIQSNATTLDGNEAHEIISNGTNFWNTWRIYASFYYKSDEYVDII